MVVNEPRCKTLPWPSLVAVSQVKTSGVSKRTTGFVDALCKRYAVDASKRNVHGALIDAELLARVYLAMTGGQTALVLDADADPTTGAADGQVSQAAARAAGELNLCVVRASAEEAAAHDAMLEKLRQSGACLWDRADAIE